MDRRRALGDEGERLAAEHLLTLGWRIAGRNARMRFGEIDLICRDRDGYVFVEVKTRRPSSFVAPSEATSTVKLRRLARLAPAWLAQRGEREAPWRIAIAAVTMTGSGAIVELIPLDRWP